MVAITSFSLSTRGDSFSAFTRGPFSFIFPDMRADLALTSAREMRANSW